MKITSIARSVNVKTQIIHIKKYVVNQCGLVMETVMMRTILKSVIMMMEIVAVIRNIYIARFANAKSLKTQSAQCQIGLEIGIVVMKIM